MANLILTSLTAPIFIISIIIFIRHVQNIAKPHTLPSSFLQAREATDNDALGFPGNPDIYGLGIRLGIYFQWIGAVLSKWFRGNPEALRDLLDENGIFLLAIFITSILLCTGGTDSPHAIEILILLHIFFGSTFIIMFDPNVSDSFEVISSFWGILVKYMITVGMAALGVWFWFTGIYKLPATPGTSSYGFFFARFAIGGPILVFFRVLAILNLIVWFWALIGSCLERLVYWKLLKVNQEEELKNKKKWKRFLHVLEELSVPSSEKWEHVPPDANLFRQLTRILFQPTLDKFSYELQPYLGDITVQQQATKALNLALFPTYYAPMSANIAIEYMIYIASNLTARTQKYLEDNFSSNELSEDQKQAIAKFKAFLTNHKEVLKPPTNEMSTFLRIVLFVLGIGPSSIKILTPKLAPDTLIFKDSSPLMVEATIRLVEPSLTMPVTGYLDMILPKIELKGRSFKFEFNGPFPLLVFTRRDVSDKEKHFEISQTPPTESGVDKVKEASVLKRIFSRALGLWYLYAVYLFGFSILVISVTAIELIIYWNHIHGAYGIKSTAQVFSLIIGAGGLWRVLYQIVLARVEKRKKKEKEESRTLEAAPETNSTNRNQSKDGRPTNSGDSENEAGPSGKINEHNIPQETEDDVANHTATFWSYVIGVNN